MNMSVPERRRHAVVGLPEQLRRKGCITWTAFDARGFTQRTLHSNQGRTTRRRLRRSRSTIQADKGAAKRNSVTALAAQRLSARL